MAATPGQQRHPKHAPAFVPIPKDYIAVARGKAHGRHPGTLTPPNTAPRRACQQKVSVIAYQMTTHA